jgi:hypothetical protein
VSNHRAYRRGNYYQWPLAVTNTSGPVYMPVTNLAVLNEGSSPDIVATNIGHAYVPETPESFGYDATVQPSSSDILPALRDKQGCGRVGTGIRGLFNSRN